MKSHLIPLVVVSVAYLASYTMTSGFILPLQKLAFPEHVGLFCLLFLPHGVRMLSVYYFGFSGLLYLVPASYMMWFFDTRVNGLDLHVLGALVSAAGCYLGLVLVNAVAKSAMQRVAFKEWQILLLAGLAGSGLNALGKAILNSSFSAWYLVAGYMIGDVFGQFALMLGLMVVFRFIGKQQR